MEQIVSYKPKHKIRFVTAAALFDGHDATINIMRRILQSTGAEVIHLGHNRSVEEVVNCAIQEDVQGIAMTSYQGGHIEYFKYMYDLLQERGASNIKIFGGGGGVILPTEIAELQAYGITRIYSPDDGRKMGLQGMINDMLQQTDYITTKTLTTELKGIPKKEVKSIAAAITVAENDPEAAQKFVDELKKLSKCKENETVELASVTTSSEEFLNFLNKRNLSLGTIIKVLQKEDFDQSMKVFYNNQEENFSKTVCDRLLVK